MTPLGSPLVPLEKGRSTTSSGDRPGSGPAAAPAKDANGTAPSEVPKTKDSWIPALVAACLPLSRKTSGVVTSQSAPAALSWAAISELVTAGFTVVMTAPADAAA